MGVSIVDPCVCVREWIYSLALELWLLAASGGTLWGSCGFCVGAITPCIRCVSVWSELKRVLDRLGSARVSLRGGGAIQLVDQLGRHGPPDEVVAHDR